MQTGGKAFFEPSDLVSLVLFQEHGSPREDKQHEEKEA